VKSLRNAFRFIKASFKLTFSHPQLRKPWLIFAAGGSALLMLWLLPMGALAGLLSFSPIGLVLIGSVGIFFVASLCLWGEIVALKICQSTAEVISEDPDELSTASKVIPSHWLDIFLYILILPGIFVTQAFNKTSNQTQRPWMTGRFLTIPIISLENLSLREALGRVEQITRDNLLRFRPGLVPVALVATVVQGIFIICGIVLGAFLTQSITAMSTVPSLWQRLLGISVGMAIAWLLTMSGTLFSTHNRSCYHTALYTWVRNVENARKNHDAQKATTPKILQYVLGSSEISKKERKNGPKKRDPHLE